MVAYIYICPFSLFNVFKTRVQYESVTAAATSLRSVNFDMRMNIPARLN